MCKGVGIGVSVTFMMSDTWIHLVVVVLPPTVESGFKHTFTFSVLHYL